PAPTTRHWHAPTRGRGRPAPSTASNGDYRPVLDATRSRPHAPRHTRVRRCGWSWWPSGFTVQSALGGLGVAGLQFSRPRLNQHAHIRASKPPPIAQLLRVRAGGDVLRTDRG